VVEALSPLVVVLVLPEVGGEPPVPVCREQPALDTRATLHDITNQDDRELLRDIGVSSWLPLRRVELGVTASERPTE
jgi:hypothetical protein